MSAIDRRDGTPMRIMDNDCQGRSVRIRSRSGEHYAGQIHHVTARELFMKTAAGRDKGMMEIIKLDAIESYRFDDVGEVSKP